MYVQSRLIWYPLSDAIISLGILVFIISYRINQEAPQVLDNEPNNWPSEGKIVFKKYSVRYRPETELVLKQLSLSIEGGEKVFAAS